MSTKNSLSIHFKYIGLDGKEYDDNLEIKIYLSSMDEDIIGRNRRSILGGSTGDTNFDSEDLLSAQARAELAIRLLNPPNWWKDSNNGALLPRELIATLYNDMAFELEIVQKENEKKYKEAREALRKEREKRRKDAESGI